MNILIIKYGALGDVIRTSYFLEGLYKKFNFKIKIFWLTEYRAYDLLRFNPFIDEIFTNISIQSPDIFKRLAQIKFDWILSLDDELYFNLNQLNYKKITGLYKDDTNIYTYTEDVARWFDMGIVSKFGKTEADILKKRNKLTHNQIFEKILNIQIEKPIFFNSKIIKIKIKRWVSSYKKNTIIGLNLHAGRRWKSKSLPKPEAIKLINFLIENNYFCFILGGIDDYNYNSKILKEIKFNKRVVLIEPMPILEFAALIAELDLLISSDSFALHLAISQKVKNISFFAPTSANEIDTFNTGYKIESLSEDYCNYKSDADNSTITAERIIEKINLILKN
jgi:heptosyltransferase II